MDKYGEKIDYPDLLRRAQFRFEKYQRSRELIATFAASDSMVFPVCRGITLDERRTLRKRLVADLLKGKKA